MAPLNIFAGLPPVDEFELKKDEVASLLAALLAYSNVSRSEVAEKLGWKRSRVTKALSGNENLTIKTIYEFTKALGWDWDVAFKEPGRATVRQPWSEAEIMTARFATDLKSFQEQMEEFEKILDRFDLPMQNGDIRAFQALAANEDHVDEAIAAAA